MVVDEPVDEVTLASALGLTRQRTRDLLAELVTDYDETGRGFELRQVAGGWRIYSRTEYAPAVERFMLDGQTAKLTQAALETLAIVAYRQPVSRARVGAVRGVNVDAVMRTLSSRGLVEDAGNDPESGAVLYRTTSYFLQRIGLSSLEELPALAPYLPEVDALDELSNGTAS
jgi:segregation and condensation protein B